MHTETKCSSKSEILPNTSLEDCKEMAKNNNANIIQMEGSNKCSYFHSSNCSSTQDSPGTTLYIRDDRVNELDGLH
jgi:hypothetical protein